MNYYCLESKNPSKSVEKFIYGNTYHNYMVLKLTHKILRLLIESKDKDFSIREVSKLLKIDYKNIYSAVQSIKDSIDMTKRSNSCFIKFKPKLSNDIYFVEKYRGEEVLKNQEINLIVKDLSSLKNPFFVAVLFGSYAKKTANKNSDIDLCIIHDNADSFKKIHSSLSIHPKIELHEFTFDEFIQLLKSKDFNVGHEIVKDGIILKNIEIYYGLIKYE